MTTTVLERSRRLKDDFVGKNQAKEKFQDLTRKYPFGRRASDELGAAFLFLKESLGVLRVLAHPEIQVISSQFLRMIDSFVNRAPESESAMIHSLQRVALTLDKHGLVEKSHEFVSVFRRHQIAREPLPDAELTETVRTNLNRAYVDAQAILRADAAVAS